MRRGELFKEEFERGKQENEDVEWIEKALRQKEREKKGGKCEIEWI